MPQDNRRSDEKVHRTRPLSSMILLSLSDGLRVTSRAEASADIVGNVKRSPCGENDWPGLLRKLRAMRRSLPCGISTDAYRRRQDCGRPGLRFVKIQVPEVRQPVTRESFRFTVDKNKLKSANCAMATTCCVPTSPAQIPLCSGPATVN